MMPSRVKNGAEFRADGLEGEAKGFEVGHGRKTTTGRRKALPERS